MSRYQDASDVNLASFNEDADITTTTASGGRVGGENLSVWREGRVDLKLTEGEVHVYLEHDPGIQVPGVRQSLRVSGPSARAAVPSMKPHRCLSAS